jgi:hypothetical protein
MTRDPHYMDPLLRPDTHKKDRSDMNPLAHPEPVAYPPGTDPILDSPRDKEAAIDDFKRVLIYSLVLSAVFIGASWIITRNY